MTPREAAAELEGCEYRNEGSKDLWARMKAARLVAVYGGSDDLTYLAGAENDERGAADMVFDRNGLVRNQCECECPYFEKMIENLPVIEPIFGVGGYSWSYRTAIPHEPFTVLEDDETYCRGIVFSLDDVEG